VKRSKNIAKTTDIALNPVILLREGTGGGANLWITSDSRTELLRLYNM